MGSDKFLALSIGYKRAVFLYHGTAEYKLHDG